VDLPSLAIIRAQMARSGLLMNQLNPYEDPDTESWIEPRQDPEMIDTAWKFLAWLDAAAKEGGTGCPECTCCDHNHSHDLDELAEMSSEERARHFRRARGSRRQAAIERAVAEIQSRIAANGEGGPGTCESCGASGEVTLPDGSRWCRDCGPVHVRPVPSDEKARSPAEDFSQEPR
jgi:hypothetical protein